jgi:hypothetical protein
LKEKLKTIVENNDIILSRYKFMEIINKQIYTSSNDKFEQKLKEFKEGLNNAKL